MAMPISDITVWTSAKSTLINPGRVINSEIPCTALNKTSFALPKASSNVTLPPITSSIRSFGMTSNESTNSPSSFMPCSAAAIRFLPSNWKGRVTTATVKIPFSRASWAITGAAPVPVPPPIPAVMKTISVPSSAAAILSRSSVAAWRPTSGFAPAPSPFVSPSPSCITFETPDR